MSTAGLFNQDAGQETADAAKAIQHDVGAGAVASAALSHDLSKLSAEELLGR
ncbi:hypothetical protein D3C86_2203430 [compost metagenome]